MKAFLNYLGQFRIYSLVDLIILLIALGGSGTQDFLGVIFLHLGFIAYLETKHSHPYRKIMPKRVWIVLSLVGILFYRHPEAILFFICSYLYTKKTQKYWGCIGPAMRGFQYFFLVGGIAGYYHPLVLIALIAIFIRNFAGDLRDIEKDRKENLKTLPILIGLNKNTKYIHLVTMLTTTFVWFSYTQLSLWLLIPIFSIQIFTYKLTPR